MKNKGILGKYLNRFFEYTIQESVEAYSQMLDVILLQSNPVMREIWCVFVYHPDIEHMDAKFEMFTDFWEHFCERRERFYSQFKKPGLGHVAVYPLFINQEELRKLVEELPARPSVEN